MWNKPVGLVKTATREHLADGNALGDDINKPIGRNPLRRISALDLTLPSHGSDRGV
jgi:hypothetical protein